MKFKNAKQRKAVMASLRGRGAINITNIQRICSTPIGKKKLSKRDVIYRGDSGKCKVKLWNTDIATINPDDSTVTLDSGGYATVTTKDRMNRVLEGSGYYIYQKNFEWFVKNPDGTSTKYEDGMKLSSPVFKMNVPKDKSPEAPIKRGYHRTDGWRGYEVPDNAIAGSSDTGGWSDSPCPSDKVDKELSALQADLKRNGIKTERATTQTSNVFCGKQWVKLKHPSDYEKAMKIVEKHKRQGNYIHDAEV